MHLDDDNDWKLVDDQSYWHLEPLKTYRYKAGNDHGTAIFVDWLDDEGISQDPRTTPTILLFKDVSDGFEWEAWYHDGAFVVAGDLLYITEAMSEGMTMKLTRGQLRRLIEANDPDDKYKTYDQGYADGTQRMLGILAYNPYAKDKYRSTQQYIKGMYDAVKKAFDNLKTVADSAERDFKEAYADIEVNSREKDEIMSLARDLGLSADETSRGNIVRFRGAYDTLMKFLTDELRMTAAEASLEVEET